MNTFLLLGLLFINVVGHYSDALPQFVANILGEGCFALAVIALVRIERLPIRETLRLRWPGWRPMALSVVLAMCAWLVGLTISVILSLVLGYSPPTSPDSYPQTPGAALLLLVATTVAAPICEEIMFRGYVQRAYERWGTPAGILIGSLIFCLYHLRFLGLLGLVPIALLLGVAAWRSGSLFPGMMLHAVYNGMVCVVIIANAFFPQTTAVAAAAVLVLFSAIMIPLSLVALWLLWRYTSAAPAPVAAPLAGWRRWVWVLPLLAVLGIYGYAAVLEVLTGRFPEVFAVESLELQSPPAWREDVHTWNYEIRTASNGIVGNAACTLTPSDAVLRLDCQMNHKQFSQKALALSPTLSAASSDKRSWEQTLSWAQDSLQIVTLERIQEMENRSPILWNLPQLSAGLTVTRGQAIQTTDLTSATLLQDEWPWRLSALPFAIAYGSKTAFVWVDDLGQVHTDDAYVGVAGGEQIWTPAGNFVTWKVALTYATAKDEKVELAAWYNVEAPYTLVRYDDGVVSYLLSSAQ